MKKYSFVIYAIPVFITTLVVSGFAYATGTTSLESLRVGVAGEGGVTFFNGSIVNEEGPVVIADDLRVDGVINRLPGEDNKPVKVDDDLEVVGNVSASNLYSKTQVDDLIDGVDTGVDAYTKAESEARYINNSEAFTQSDADGRYYTKSATDSAVAAGLVTAATLYVPKATPTWSARTGYVVIPAISFIADDSSTFTSSEGAFYDETAGATNYYAPLSLPHGATFTAFEAAAIDSSASGNLAVYLSACPLQNWLDEEAGSCTDFSVISSSGSGGAQAISDVTFVAPYAVVDNSEYQYVSKLAFSGNDGSDLQLRGARVTYTYTAPY